MKLDQFYSLRINFTVIGLTGHVGSGCSRIANKLADASFIKNIENSEDDGSHDIEKIKHKRCYDFLKNGNNWKKFEILNYKDILLLHMLFEALSCNSFEEINNKIVSIIAQNGKNPNWKNRFDLEADHNFFEQNLKPFLAREESKQIFNSFKTKLIKENLCESIKTSKKDAFNFYFKDDIYKSFAKGFYDVLNDYSIIKRSRLTHDLANNLRASGTVYSKTDALTLDNIYTIAETINQLIKAWRSENPSTKIVIDALKNSLELMYFKEKYAAFYMVAANTDDLERRRYLCNVVGNNVVFNGNIDETVNELLRLDEAEYKSNNFKDGNFSSPDIENCIQKSDYHIHCDNASFDSQIIKFIALINQPGIVTPSTQEHFMQVAYNAKFNSGCISRQVGAVVTDSNNSIKAIGWNDVPENQIPCRFRDIQDLVKGSQPHMFSPFEKTGGDYNGSTFRDRAKETLDNSSLDNLNGKNCSFCFKAFHNAFEGEKNQVHTRSLHAEENAMMQITKYGGQGIKNGNLYTTASPCELCSKKAFQLGIKNIYYVDPYPGIAKDQILTAGLDSNDNPNLIMFQGAVGRAFHKLYEPFMSYKDEISILTNLKPQTKVEDILRTLIRDSETYERIQKKINDKTENEKLAFIEKYLRMSLDKL